MDARLVWDTWRQILRDDDLADVVTRAGPMNAAAVAGLSDAAIDVVSDYALTPKATATNIGMYRRGLVRIAHIALGRLPLSQRLLFMCGLDVDQVVSEFVRAHGHVDDGPNFWRLADAFVAYLATCPEFAAPTHQDVLALDRTLAALARRLGSVAVPSWPDAMSAQAGNFHGTLGPHRRFVASRAAAVFGSHHDLTPWIEDPHGFDPAQALDPSPRHWLVYFPDAESAPAYAELSERSARMFEQLAVPQTAAEAAEALGDLSEDEARVVIGRLAALGVVGESDAGWRDSLGAVPGDDEFILLDPSVEMLELEVAEHRLLCHGHLGVGMAVPPGEGLSDFVLALAHEPVRVGALRRGFDDQRLVDTMLAALRQHGFLLVTPPVRPSGQALETLRRHVADELCRSLCHTLDMPLETSTAHAIQALVQAQGMPPELHLRCARLADHAAVLTALAEMRQVGRLRLHRAMVRAADIAGSTELIPALRGLGAEVVIDGVPWPLPDRAIAGLEALARAGVPVHACMTPDRSLLEPAMQQRARGWCSAVFLTGLGLRLDARLLWPDRVPDAADFFAAFEAVRALEDALGDVWFDNLPSDEVLLGQAAPQPVARSELDASLRLAYLRWRLPLLKAYEGDNTFSQTPDAEEKLVRLKEDLLPNHPELLKLQPGSVIVDVCGGNGRVARRLSPLVGRDGLVVSIEMLRCVSDRARRFACELGFTNIQFRSGLAQRLPLPDGAADAAVNEWTGAIWQLGLGTEMLGEMARVVRVGGRIAVTHRLVRLPLTRLDQPWVQFGDIYGQMQAAFARPGLKTVCERVWGQTVSSLTGEKATAWRKHYMPRVINPFDVTYTQDSEPGPHADVCLTIIAERVQ